MSRSLQQGPTLQGPAQTGIAALTSPKAASWHRQMREATADQSLLVLGDSTGAGTTRWPYLLTGYLARQYPDWTVVYQGWDDTSKTYLAGNKLTVQKGTNGRTVTIWNGSVSGQTAGYAMNNVGTMTSGIGTPAVVFFNYGHNSPQVTDDYRAIHIQALQVYLNLYPNALVVSIIQNPRVTADAAYSSDQGKQQAIYDMSANLGLTIVDVNEAFRLYGNGNFAALMNADGLHPNDNTGSPLWAQLVWNAIKPTGVIAPAAQQSSSTQIWVPANQFFALTGSPTLQSFFGQQAWAMNDSALNEVACSVHIPSQWKRQNVWILWTTNQTTTNPVMWTGGHMYLGASINMGTWTMDNTGSAQNAPNVAGRGATQTVFNRVTFGVSPIALKVGRDGANAGDTLVGDALMLGMMIERAY